MEENIYTMVNFLAEMLNTIHHITEGYSRTCLSRSPVLHDSVSFIHLNHAVIHISV